MEDKTKIPVGYMGDHFSQYKGNLKLKERTLGKYLKRTDLYLGDNTKIDKANTKVDPKHLDRLKQANKKRLKKVLIILLAWAIAFATLIVVFYGYLS